MSRQISTGATPSNIKRYAAKTAALFAAIALIAAMTVPAVGTSTGRASANHAPLEAIFGTVVEVKVPDSITVATNSGVRTVVVPDNNVFTGDITAVEDITEGDRVVGSVHVGADGVTTADKLLIVPDLTKSVTRHILGVILEVKDGVVVVQDRDGNTIDVDVPSGIDVPPAGSAVTAVAQLDRATGRLKAQAFDRVEDAVQRIQDATDRVTDPDLKEKLEDRLERARDQHLSALERARQGLEQAQKAVSAAIAEREEAKRRLDEVKAKFDDLRKRYVQEANDRNERLPELRTEGALSYNEDEWAKETGSFTLTPRINNADDSVVRTFKWTKQTLAIIPVEIRESDPSSPAVTATIARSIALPFNDVKSLIPSGSQVVVQYDPNANPPIATLLIVLPPKLPDAIENALERERLRSINGFITLVDETPGLDGTIGVVVVANRQHDLNVAAKVTSDTEIVIDGKSAKFGQLAAGMSIEVDFEAAATPASSDAGASLTGRLNALRIRANSNVDDDQVHVTGVIAGLDPETRTVGILTREGDIVRAQIVDEAVIVKDGVRSSFAALQTGDVVLEATRFNRRTLVFTKLAVQSPKAVTLSGRITGLDRNPDRLTVTTVNGRVLAIFIAESSEIHTENGSAVKFSALTVGDKILKGEALPVQRDGHTVLVATELVVGNSNVSTARGVVTVVSEDSGKLRITTGVDNSVATSTEIDLALAENNRSVLYKNGVRIHTLTSVKPKDIVESVSYVTATGVIVKMSVVSPNFQRARGFVSAVTNNGVTVKTSNGLMVGLGVTDQTVMTLNGRSITSLKLVDRGDIVVEVVYIANKDNAASGSALKLTLISPLPASGESLPPTGSGGSGAQSSAVETTISGVIEEISDSKWQIGDRKFKITADTRFFGERPQAGLVAKATLVLNGNGDFVASAISVAGRPTTNPTSRPVEIQPVEPGDTPGLVRILGKVQSFERGSDGRLAVIVVDGVNVVLVTNTVIAGEPKVGVSALAVVRRTAGGTVVANSIVFIKKNEEAEEADEDAGTGTDADGTSSTPADTPGSEPSEDRDGTKVSDDNEDTRADTASSDIKLETITVERISGRVVVSGGKTYLLKPLQVLNLSIGATITVRVREIGRENINRELSIVDRLVVTGNPLYQATTKAGENKLFIAE